MIFDRDALLAKWRDMITFCEPLSEWTTGFELAWLAEMASTRKLIVEVGSYKGKSAKAMTWSSTIGVLHCVDRFQADTRGAFKANLSSELVTGRVVLHDMESAQAAKKLRGLQADLIFIDASHGKEDVIRDIEVWNSLLAPNGILCGHDCYPSEPNNGVQLALAALEMNYSVVADTIWVRN